MVTSRPATSRSCFRAGMAPRYDRKTPAQRKRALERRSRIRGARHCGLLPAQVMRARHRYMTGVLAGVRLLPIASVLLGSAARGWPRALVLDHLVVLGRGLHDRQLERGLAVGHRLRRDLEAALRHR